MKFPVATIVNFCTNEKRFIGPCLREALKFSGQVVVPVASHFFDGTEENRALLEEIYAAFPECLFIEYPFVPDQIPPYIFKELRPSNFWHCLSRLIGVHALDEEIERVLFVDADEVADGDRVAEWLGSGKESDTVMRLANYWYFREPIYQALTLEDSIVFAQKRALDDDILLQNGERGAIYDQLPCPKRRMVLGCNGKPLFHHYSWVRDFEEMLKKVKTWGHKNDRNWEALVKEEFSRPFTGVDFVHGYQFRKVLSQLVDEPSFKPRGKPNVKRLYTSDVIEYALMKKVSIRSRFRLLFR